MKQTYELNLTNDQKSYLLRLLVKEYEYLNGYNEMEDEKKEIKDMIKQLNNQ